MILTVTLNTSIDKAYQLDGALEAGTVMRVARCSNSAGGKGLNASRAVASCGATVLATGFVGGHNGSLLLDLLGRDGIPQRFVRVGSETRSCINVLEGQGRSTEFLEPGASVTGEEFRQLVMLVREEAGRAGVVTMSGSVPAGLPKTAWAELVSTVRAEGVPVILDSSGASLERAVRAATKPTVIKPNVDEISQLVGHRIASIPEVVDAARRLHGAGIRDVIVSLGGDGAVLVTDEGAFRGSSPAITVLNPVGSGDTLVGAYAVAMERGLPAPERLRYAMSRATANCLSPETGRFDANTADDLLARTMVEPVR